jgi:hypothetical protein
MLISKFPVWICALLSCGALALHAQDTPAQAAARAALQQKMDELDANPPTTTSPSAPDAVTNAPVIEVTPVGAAPVVETPAPKPAEQTPMLVDPPPAVTVRETAETGASISNADVEAQKQIEAAAQAKDAAQKTADATAKADAEAKAQAAVDAKKRAEAEKAAVSAATANYPGKEMGLKPIEAPALPISAAKAQKLDELLARYKADHISAEEYHTQRAAILAEP